MNRDVHRGNAVRGPFLAAALVLSALVSPLPVAAESDLAFCLSDRCDFSKGVQAAKPCIDKCVQAFPPPPKRVRPFYHCLFECGRRAGAHFDQSCVEMCVQTFTEEF